MYIVLLMHVHVHCILGRESMVFVKTAFLGKYKCIRVHCIDIDTDEMAKRSKSSWMMPKFTGKAMHEEN